jgi:hypothetical protein
MYYQVVLDATNEGKAPYWAFVDVGEMELLLTSGIAHDTTDIQNVENKRSVYSYQM